MSIADWWLQIHGSSSKFMHGFYCMGLGSLGASAARKKRQMWNIHFQTIEHPPFGRGSARGSGFPGKNTEKTVGGKTTTPGFPGKNHGNPADPFVVQLRVAVAMAGDDAPYNNDAENLGVRKNTVKMMNAAFSPRSHSPIIFLDIDGVLNRTKHATHIRLDDDLMERFQRLVEVTGANIVLSTYWRHFGEYISYVLSNYGIPEDRILGSTPGFNRSMKGRKASDDREYSSRAEEIRAWLKEYQLDTMNDNRGNSITEDNEQHQQLRFVILDDRPTAADDTEYLQSRFIHCDTTKGLTEEDVERAIRILQEGQ